MSDAHPYRGREAVLATRHAKERVIAPALYGELGLVVRVPPGVDTDRFGTFTGEIERPGPPRETALMKARHGLELADVPRALASEGAFGPHPHAPLLAGGLEVLALVDTELGIEVVEQRLSLETNFAHCRCRGYDAAAERFLARVGFPVHAVVARPNEGDGPIVKGIADADRLAAALTRCAEASVDGLARLETDMRAHLNPTRMHEIARLADQFARRLATRCPACGAPGYGRVDATAGLPCSDCGTPTDWVLTETHGCPRCPHRASRPRGDGLTAVDPAQCPVCNP